MDLHIWSSAKALAHRPDKPTYAIRIFSSWSTDQDKAPFLEIPLYVAVAQYVFDDNDTWPFRVTNGPKWFDEETAEAIIRDLAAHISRLEALVVSCSREQNRSPAVAGALNVIFSLGQDPKALHQKYEDSNRFVYETMVGVAQRMGLR